MTNGVTNKIKIIKSNLTKKTNMATKKNNKKIKQNIVNQFEKQIKQQLFGKRQ